MQRETAAGYTTLRSFSAFTLLNKERMLRFSQKYLRLNVGRIGSDVADAGKPSHMIGPGIGLLVVGAIVLFESFAVASRDRLAGVRTRCRHRFGNSLTTRPRALSVWSLGLDDC